MDARKKFHGKPYNGCLDISVLTKMVDRKTKISMHRATWEAWLSI